jgi:hypothetical protein
MFQRYVCSDNACNTAAPEYGDRICYHFMAVSNVWGRHMGLAGFFRARTIAAHQVGEGPHGRPSAFHMDQRDKPSRRVVIRRAHKLAVPSVKCVRLYEADYPLWKR